MSEKSLYNIVNSAAEQDENSGKKHVGYTVSSYQGVLSALEKAKIVQGGSSGPFGVERIDYSSVGTNTYDENGFCTDLDVPVWKMKLSAVGPVPIYKDGWYEMVSFPNESSTSSKNFNNPALMPYTLSEDIARNLPHEKFSIGAFVDLSNLAVKYFNNYYSKGDTAVDKFSEKMVSSLIGRGCLYAQVIFPSKNEYATASIIGRTPISKVACCYISTPLFASSEWKNSGFAINITENGTNSQELIPNGANYKSVSDGKSYNPVNASMVDMNSENYAKWVERRGEIYNNDRKVLSLVKPSLQDCFVTLYIPSDKRSIAQQYLPSQVSDRIFSPYGGKRIPVYQGDATFSGDVAASFIHVIDKWSKVKTNNGIGSIEYGLNNKAIGSTGEYGLGIWRPKNLVKGRGGVMYSGSTQFTPLYGHQDNLYNYDCSALIAMILYDTGIMRDDISSLVAFSSSSWASSAVGYINQHIKDGFQAVMMDINSSTTFLPGDILIVTADELGKSYGHAAMAAPSGGKTYTIEIGSKEKVRDLKVYYGRTDNNFYRHLIRIVKK